jgi:uncharacterized protein YukE
MDSVIVDPEEMRHFASALARNIEALEAGMSSLSIRHAALGETWRDQKYQQFDKVWLDTKSRLRAFLKQAGDYASYLRQKAALADRYLDHSGY